MTDRLSDEDRQEIRKAFREAVGHKSGRRIAEIKHRKKADISEDESSGSHTGR